MLHIEPTVTLGYSYRPELSVGFARRTHSHSHVFYAPEPYAFVPEAHARPIGSAEITHEHIAVRAYFKWLERGCPEGDGERDWYCALGEILQEQERRAAAPAFSDRATKPANDQSYTGKFNAALSPVPEPRGQRLARLIDSAPESVQRLIENVIEATLKTVAALNNAQLER
ncbi:MAG TPA: DUF2934 domain-containing protein [Polyangiaceae bacterium]|nr:DUF2934 domain-containing protein [Polyangiaceae bacterium]